MATIKDLQEWIERDITRFGAIEQYALLDYDGPDENGRAGYGVKIFTDANAYKIIAVESDESYNGYLGCQGHSRKPRAGEDWTRGNDLADGPLTEETWQKILGDIVSYEMVRINRREGVPIPKREDLVMPMHGSATDEPS